MNEKQQRMNALERQIQRVQTRIERLERLSNRYSWVRVTIFFVGIALSIVSYVLVNWWVCVLLAVVTLVAFGIVAQFHGKIDASINRHFVWQRLKATHIARMHLDWNTIPSVSLQEPLLNHPFETDLDITGSHSVHRLLNMAVTPTGSQRLRNWLLSTTPDAATIQKRQALVRELTPLTRFRDKLILKSLIASRSIAEQLEGDRLLRWLNQPPPSASLVPLLLGSAALSLLTIVLLVLNLFVVMPQFWIFTLLCSAILFFTTAKLRGDLFEDATYLRAAFSTLHTVFGYLEQYPYGTHERLKRLCAPFCADAEHRPSVLLGRIERVAAATVLEKNVLLRLIINVLVPWEVYCAYRLRQYKTQIAAYLPTWLDCWFELEALNSLAAFAYLNPSYTLPELVTGNEQDEQHALLQAEEIGHPLIPDEKKVTNDLALHQLGEIVIITGSNMSGKSTFLRTLGVNLCLAYAGGPVNAYRFQSALFRIFTCIKVSDSVTDGYSYFYAEVRRLRALLTALEQSSPSPLFFLIDEIFKGTNNRERLIGSRSYVRALVGKQCVGLISTHDLELVKLADTLPQVSNAHFKEDVIDGQMVFDYTLRSGPSPTTNALKIMRMEGLPVDDEGAEA